MLEPATTAALGYLCMAAGMFFLGYNAPFVFLRLCMKERVEATLLHTVVASICAAVGGGLLIASAAGWLK